MPKCDFNKVAKELLPYKKLFKFQGEMGGNKSNIKGDCFRSNR